MRYFKFYIVLLFLAASGCRKTENHNKPVSSDATKPGKITGAQVRNFNGGAEITYTLPNSENILYVEAVYGLGNGTTRTTKASYYKNKLTVEGFAESKEYDVILTVVSKSDVKSDPVTVKVLPATPVYRIVRSSLALSPDFGGLAVSGKNELKGDVGIMVITPDGNNELALADQFFTDKQDISFSVQGYNTDERKFGVYVVDEWGNKSDTAFLTFKPIFERLIPKAGFRRLGLPGDRNSTWGAFETLWNGTNQGTGWHTDASTPLPHSLTIDMGTTSQLSRYRIFLRPDDYAFYHGNPKRWTMWGSTAPNPNGAFDESWVKMGDFNVPAKPSGLPAGQNSAEDIALNNAGFEYRLPINLPPVRYIRFQFHEGSTAQFIHVMEITVWGN